LAGMNALPSRRRRQSRPTRTSRLLVVTSCSPADDHHGNRYRTPHCPNSPRPRRSPPRAPQRCSTARHPGKGRAVEWVPLGRREPPGETTDRDPSPPGGMTVAPLRSVACSDRWHVYFTWR
jgi:hypothetical protein